jgi:hypothetical protein
VDLYIHTPIHLHDVVLNYLSTGITLLYGSTALCLELGRLFSFLILYTVDRTLWTEDFPLASKVATYTE